MTSADYNFVGKNYSKLRKADPIINKYIVDALLNIDSIINVGAGTGSYEPKDKKITAIEPSSIMRNQRDINSNAEVFNAVAENLPFNSNSFDAAMAILSIHHWNDWKKGLQEMIRVSRYKLVLLTWIDIHIDFWLYDYFPKIRNLDINLFPSLEDLSNSLGNFEIITVPIPSTCQDGFLCAYWLRPDCYLNPSIRSAISTFSRMEERDLNSGLIKLSNDLRSGAWYEKYKHLLNLKEFDFGYRLIVHNKIPISNI